MYMNYEELGTGGGLIGRLTDGLVGIKMAPWCDEREGEREKA